jgi:hypothetical protein
MADPEKTSTLLDQLRALAAADRDVQAATREVVAALRAAGCTWEQIGQALGVTRQAARHRFGR